MKKDTLYLIIAAFGLIFGGAVFFYAIEQFGSLLLSIVIVIFSSVFSFLWNLKSFILWTILIILVLKGFLREIEKLDNRVLRLEAEVKKLEK